MIVIDASVLANALTDDGPVGDVCRAQLTSDPHWLAPEHVVVELYSAIRGRWLGRHLSQQRAWDALDAVPEMTLDLAPTTPLLGRMWQLRDNVSGYDAAYIALAERNECVLVTADERLTRVPDVNCAIRLAAPSL